MARELTDYQRIERTITKTYRKELWNPFIRCVKSYKLVNDNDKIAVCVEDSAPSMLTAKLMSHLMRISETEFSLKLFVFEENAAKNAELMNLPYIKANSREEAQLKARELGCNKIAVFDTLDDVNEKLLFNMFYSGEIKTILPAEGEYIRPLYCIENYYIDKWKSYNSLSFSKNEKLSDEEITIKKLLEKLCKMNPDVKRNVLTSLHSLNLDTFPKL